MSKIADLQRNGCNDKVSWSKNGSIAYIDSDGAAYVVNLVCTDGEQWQFSSPIRLLAKDSANDSTNTDAKPRENGRSANSSAEPLSIPTVHVSWNTGGTELACIDAQGDISIYSFAGHNSNGLLSCHLSKSPGHSGSQIPAPLYELNAIVGFKWLDIDKAILLPSPAVINPDAMKTGGSTGAAGGYKLSYGTYGVSQGRLSGPYNPSQTKFTCIAITRRGMLRLISQIPTESRYYEVVTPLDEQAASLEIITHATFKGQKDNSLLVATYSAQTSTLQVYKIVINWANADKNRQQQTTATSEFASVSVQRLLKTFLSPSHANPNNATDNDCQKYLTHLFLVPSYPQLSKSQFQRQSSPSSDSEHELYAIFSTSSGSLVHKYEIANRPVSLHPNFYGLSYQRRDSGPTTNEESVASITLYDSYSTEKHIVAIGSAVQETLIYLCRSDGVIDLIRRQSSAQSQLNPQPPKIEIATLSDAGYIYTNKDIPDVLENICLSPNLASYVYFDQKGTLKIKYMENPNDYADSSTMVMSVVGLAMRVSSACFSSVPSDDVSYIAKMEMEKIRKINGDELAQKFRYMLLQESYRANNFTVNIPNEYPNEKVFVNPSLQRLLSLQLSLSTNPEWTRQPMAHIAWCTLNLRIASFAITFALRAVSSNKQQQGDYEIKANHIHSLAGLVRWITDFLALACQDLYMASLHESNNYYGENPTSVAMASLLGKIPRVLLLYCLRATRGLEQIIAKLAEQENNPINGQVQSAYKRFRDTIANSPVSVASFEKLLFDIDNAMKNMSADLTDVEQDIMFNAHIPNQYANVCKRAVEVFGRNLKPEINIAQLYFYDVSWLGLNGPKLPPGWDNNDVIRKTLISHSDPSIKNLLRRCARCGGVSLWEDVRAPSSVTWAVAFQRSCLCGGNWYISTSWY